jgi:hypothetical protein
MSKHLTITRLGLLTAVPQASPPLITSEFLIGAFRNQAEAIARTFPAPRPGVGSIEAKQIEIAEVTAERPITPFDEPSFVNSALFGRTFGLHPIRVGHLTGDEHRLVLPFRPGSRRSPSCPLTA